MPINAINKLGPLCFNSSTLNNSSGSSINSLLENFISVGTNDFSISASLGQILKRTGNFYTETKTYSVTNAVGCSVSNYNGKRPIKFSSFFNATYLSASIILDPVDGTVITTAFSPSVIRINNFLTGNSQDQVFKYSLYTKTGTTTPITDTGWKKVYSYSKSGNNYLKLYNLADSNSYKITVKDCLSNAFTSSMFVGTCTDVLSNQDSYSYTVDSADLDAAISILNQQINDNTNLLFDQKRDLITIFNNLSQLIVNPKFYKTSPTALFPSITYFDSNNISRTLYFDGLIYQDTNKSYIFNGSIYAHSISGVIPDYYYSFEDTSTSGKVTLYILGRQTKVSGTNCEEMPNKVGNFPSIIYISGPTCGELDCGIGKAQPVCNPTSYTQIRHSGSFIITNDNDHEMTVNISNNWRDFSNEEPNAFLSPITILPSNSFTIPSKSFKKLSILFGSQNTISENQPTKFFLKTDIDLSLPVAQNYVPSSIKSELRAIFDKNSCLIGVESPYIVSQASNIGNVYYTGKINENWQTIKTKISNLISNSYGIYSDKLYGRAIVQTLPLTECVLPTTITLDGVQLTLTWTQVTSSPIQPNLCNNVQFSGTYNVIVSNSKYGTSIFYVYFLRKNDNSLGSYINLTQLGGTSNPF